MQPSNDRILLFLISIVLLSYGRILIFHDVYWDDNCWLLSRYATSSLSEFLDDGFNEMRRVPLGVFIYAYFGVLLASDHGFLVAELFGLTLQVAAPLLLYRLCFMLTDGSRFVALTAALALVLAPIDHSLPFLSTTNYRLGLGLELLSFVLTIHALKSGQPSVRLLVCAAILSAINSIVLVEAASTLELIRIPMIWWLSRSSQPRGLGSKRLLAYSMLFLIPAAAVLTYKLTYKPYGMYASMYANDWSAMGDWQRHQDTLNKLFFGLWRHLKRPSHGAIVPALPLGVVVSLVTYRASKGLFEFVDYHPPSRRQLFFIGMLGGGIIIVQQLTFVFARREIRWGPDSSHAWFLQVGLAMITAIAAFNALRSCSVRVVGERSLRGILAILVGIGVMFNNVNLDRYRAASDKQHEFWTKFIQRFPSLPPQASFILDVYVGSFHDAADLDSNYDLEAYLNLLYATSTDARSVYRYRVLSPEEMRINIYDFAARRPIVRMGRLGLNVIDPVDAIVVAYRDGRILVNSEIYGVEPNIPYAPWIDRSPPNFPLTINNYPFRSRLLPP